MPPSTQTIKKLLVLLYFLGVEIKFNQKPKKINIMSFILPSIIKINSSLAKNSQPNCQFPNSLPGSILYHLKQRRLYLFTLPVMSYSLSSLKLIHSFMSSVEPHHLAN